MTKVTQDDFLKYYRKTTKFRDAFQRYLKFRQVLLRRSFFFWKFQVRFSFPFHRKENRMSHTIIRIVENENTQKKLKHRSYGTIGASTTLDILLKLDKLRTLLGTRFRSQKLFFLTRLKIFSSVEKKLVSSNSMLTLNMIRFNNLKLDSILKSDLSKNRKHLLSDRRRIIDVLKNKEMYEGQFYDSSGPRPIGTSYLKYHLSNNKFDPRSKKRGQSTSLILMQGAWASPRPFLRFEEILICDVLKRRFRFIRFFSFSKLKENKRFVEAEFATYLGWRMDMKLFKLNWSKVWLINLFKDKIQRDFDATLKNLEFHKLLTDKITIRSEELAKSKLKSTHKDSKEFKSNILGRLEKEYEVALQTEMEIFPQKFIQILLLGKRDANETRKRVVSLLFDTMFALFCNVIIKQDSTYLSNLQEKALKL